jgi:succinate dehydrogenase / fumarate reductase iron-sulfur subunit
MSKAMTIHLRVWRQDGPNSEGKLVDYKVDNVIPEMSFLEMLDVLNDRLATEGQRPIAFDSDCREGICGTCGLVINGVAHGPLGHTTTCGLRMRHFKDGDTITVEPWRAASFPVIKDLVVDRTAFDRIVQAGGYVSINTGSAPDANAVPVGKHAADQSMDAAICIGCGACVAACPNASAYLFTAARVAKFSVIPQGQPERDQRVLNMVGQHDKEGFGDCSNHGECEAVCPKGISIRTIAQMRRDFFVASLRS